MTGAFDPVTASNRMMDIPLVVKFAVFECSPKWVFRNRLPRPHEAGRTTRGSTVIPATRLIDRPNLTSSRVGVGDKNVKAPSRHESAGVGNQERSGVWMRPVHARSTVQCFHQVCTICSTNGGCGFRSSGAPEADGSCQVLTTIKSERKIRRAHIAEPFVFENDLFRFQLANLLHHRIF